MAIAKRTRLGGRDPYSASKAAAELIIASYRNSFFQDHPVKIASCRAGNVIGGGDWAHGQNRSRLHRRACKRTSRSWCATGAPPVRGSTSWNRSAVISGSARRWPDPKLRRCDLPLLTSAFNFGPNHDSNRTVEELVEEVLQHWPGRWQDKTDPNAPHEAGLLQLSTDKAYALAALVSGLVFFRGGGQHGAIGIATRSSFGAAKEFQKQTQAQISQYIDAPAPPRRPGPPAASP